MYFEFSTCTTLRGKMTLTVKKNKSQFLIYKTGHYTSLPSISAGVGMLNFRSRVVIGHEIIHVFNLKLQHHFLSTLHCVWSTED